MGRVRQKFGASVLEWTHGNSLVYEPEEDAYYLLAKFTDWLLKVDRTTGALEWQLNGPASDFVDPSGAPVWPDVHTAYPWSHGHTSQVWPGGVMVFDNGDHHEDSVATLVELAIDPASREVERVWTYAHPDGGQTPAMGDARKLPGGNVLAAWATLGEVTEVTPEGTLVWRAQLSGSRGLGRVRWLGPTLDPL